MYFSFLGWPIWIYQEFSKKDALVFRAIQMMYFHIWMLISGFCPKETVKEAFKTLEMLEGKGHITITTTYYHYYNHHYQINSYNSFKM